MTEPDIRQLAKNFFSQVLTVTWMNGEKATCGEFLQQLDFNQTGNFTTPFYAAAESILQRIGNGDMNLDDGDRAILKGFHVRLLMFNFDDDSKAKSDQNQALDPGNYVKMLKKSGRERIPSLNEAAQAGRQDYSIAVENTELLDKLIVQFKIVSGKIGMNFGIERA